MTLHNFVSETPVILATWDTGIWRQSSSNRASKSKVKPSIRPAHGGSTVIVRPSSVRTLETSLNSIKNLLSELEKIRSNNNSLPDLLGGIAEKHKKACDKAGVTAEKYETLSIVLGCLTSEYYAPYIGNGIFSSAQIKIAENEQFGYRFGSSDDGQSVDTSIKPLYSIGNVTEAALHELIHAADPRIKSMEDSRYLRAKDGRCYLPEFYAMRLTNLFMKEPYYRTLCASLLR